MGLLGCCSDGCDYYPPMLHLINMIETYPPLIDLHWVQRTREPDVFDCNLKALSQRKCFVLLNNDFTTFYNISRTLRFFHLAMGNKTSICGQLNPTIIENLPSEYLEEYNSHSITDNYTTDPLRNFLTHSSALKVKTLNNILNTPCNKLSRQATATKATLQEQIVDRIRRKTANFDQQQDNLEIMRLLQEEIESLAREKTQNGEEVNVNSIDRQTVFKKLKINVSNFIRIIPDNVCNYYSFKEIIGQGSFGKVYRAICRRTKEERAIKVLKNKVARKQDAKLLSQFSLLSQLDHPNIVKLYEIYYYKSFYYVVMEYCKGGSIIELVKKLRQFPESLVVSIVQQLLGALAYLHGLGIVHRDIKIDNIVFLNVDDPQRIDYHIKIIDFGTATRKTQKCNKIAGTRFYMAPEVFKGVLHEKSDVWSCGVFLYLFFTGKFPFKGKSNTDLEFDINTRTITFSDYQWKQISVQARKLILGMLERNIDKRLSAREALNHPWFKKHADTEQVVSFSACNLELLEKYQRGNNLIAIIESYLSLSEISQQERQRLAVVFKRIDTNNDGTIQASELMALYSEHFGVQNQEQVTRILQKLDQNQSGKIDFNEFLVAMYTRKRLFLENALTDAFKHYDANHDGFLQRSELKSLLEGCQRQQIEYLLQQLDSDGDQRVSLSQFLDYMREFH